jgi:hypothetical protein
VVSKFQAENKPDIKVIFSDVLLFIEILKEMRWFLTLWLLLGYKFNCAECDEKFPNITTLTAHQKECFRFKGFANKIRSSSNFVRPKHPRDSG